MQQVPSTHNSIHKFITSHEFANEQTVGSRGNVLVSFSMLAQDPQHVYVLIFEPMMFNLWHRFAARVTQIWQKGKAGVKPHRGRRNSETPSDTWAEDMTGLYHPNRIQQGRADSRVFHQQVLLTVGGQTRCLMPPRGLDACKSWIRAL